MKRFLPIFIGVGIGALYILIFFGNFIFHVAQPISLDHNDSHMMSFILHHYFRVLESGNWANWSTFPMFYGFEKSAFFAEFFPLQVLFTYPIFFLTKNIFLVANTISIVTVLFSYSAMHIYSWYLTRRIWPSVIAGIIFSLNPLLMARFPDHMLVLNVGFLPLTFLCIELILSRRYKSGVLLLLLVLSGQLLMSSVYYSVFLTVLLPIYTVIRCMQAGLPRKQDIFNVATAFGLILCITVSGSIAWLYLSANAERPFKRSVQESVFYSAAISDWFFTAPASQLYGSLKSATAKKFPTIVREGVFSEQNLFTGIIPFILICLGIWAWMKKKADRRLIAIGAVAIVSWILSLGPRVMVTDTIQFTGPYHFLYVINPFFSLIRVPARFGVIVFLAVALFSAHGLSWVEQSISKKKYMMIIVCILLGIGIEYAIKPIDVLREDVALKQAYESVNKRQDIQVLFEYPIGNSIDYTFPQARMEELDAHYLVYALLYHNKVLLNGYSGFLPKEYYARADALSVNFPTRTKLSSLHSWGADAMVIHKDEFTQRERYDDVIESLKNLGVPQSFSTDRIAVYDLTTWNASP